MDKKSTRQCGFRWRVEALSSRISVLEKKYRRARDGSIRRLSRGYDMMARGEACLLLPVSNRWRRSYLGVGPRFHIAQLLSLPPFYFALSLTVCRAWPARPRCLHLTLVTPFPLFSVCFLLLDF